MRHRPVVVFILLLLTAGHPACETTSSDGVVTDTRAGSDTTVVWPDTQQPPPTDTGGIDPSMCPANNDGQIEMAEMPIVPGVVVSYMSNALGQTVAVNPAGTATDSGVLWDFVDGPADVVAALDIVAVSGAWFYPHFPSGTYATPVLLTDLDELAVFQVTDSTIEMLGLVSRHELPDNQLTLLVYDTPVVVYRFPIRLGQSWEQQVEFRDARLKGIKNAGRETYTFSVDAVGTLQLPQFGFENTLRVRLELTQMLAVSQGSNIIQTVRYFYVHECAGEVARIVGLPGHTELDFTTASEFRRLGF